MRGVGWRDLSVCVCYLYVLYIDEIPAWATRAHGICCLPDFLGASEQEPLLPCSTTACCIIYAVCSITAERFVTIVLADLEQCRTVLDMPGSLHQLELCFQHYTATQYYTATQSLRYKAVSLCWWCCVCCIVLLTLCIFYEPAMTTTKLLLVGWWKLLNWIEFTNWNCVFSIIPLLSPWDTKQFSPVGTVFSALYLCSVLEIQSSFHRLELCFQHYTSAQSLRYKAVFTG